MIVLVIKCDDGSVMIHNRPDQDYGDAANQQAIAEQFATEHGKTVRVTDGFALYDPAELSSLVNYDRNQLDIVSGSVVANVTNFNKTALMKIIDMRTQWLINEGFEYPAASGNVMSLSIPAQINWIGVHQNKAAAGQYPISVMNKSDTDKITLTGSSDVDNYFDAAYNTVRQIISDGSDIKKNIKDAADDAAAQAAADADSRTTWDGRSPPF